MVNMVDDMLYEFFLNKKCKKKMPADFSCMPEIRQSESRNLKNKNFSCLCKSQILTHRLRIPEHFKIRNIHSIPVEDSSTLKNSLSK